MDFRPNKQAARIRAFLNRNPDPIFPQPIPDSPKFKNNTILIVCDQLINFKNIPDRILDIMPGYKAFQSLGIQFNDIYNNTSL